MYTLLVLNVQIRYIKTSTIDVTKYISNLWRGKRWKTSCNLIKVHIASALTLVAFERGLTWFNVGTALNDDNAPGFKLKYTQLILNWLAPIIDLERVFIWSTRMYVSADDTPFLWYLGDCCVVQINEFLNKYFFNYQDVMYASTFLIYSI